MNPTYSKKTIATAIALTLMLSGCLLYGAGQASASGASSTGSLHKGYTLERYSKLQDLKSRWRKQTEETRKGSLPVIEEAAAILGLEADKLRALLDEGKSIADVAQSKGMTEEQLVDQLLAVRIGKIDEAVKSGKLSQERADAIRKKLSSHIGFMVRQHEGKPESTSSEGKTKRHERVHVPLQHLNPDKLSAIIGMPKEELIEQLKNGKSLADIAESKGMTKQQLIDRIKDEITPLLEQSVEKSRSSKEQS